MIHTEIPDGTEIKPEEIDEEIYSDLDEYPKCMRKSWCELSEGHLGECDDLIGVER